MRKVTEYKYRLYAVLGLWLALSVHVLADDVWVGVGASVPPYIQKETGSGAELDLIREALAASGDVLRIRFLAGNGLANNLKAGRIDALLMNSGYDAQAHLGIDAFYSQDLLSYRNYVISLSKDRRTVDRLEDLKSLRIVAFFNASKVLGNAFYEMTRRNPYYREVPLQADQVLALYRGLADVVIADRNIFEHFQSKVAEVSGELKEVSFHPLFKPSPRRLVFVDLAIRDRFNRGLRVLRESGRYTELMKLNGVRIVGEAP